MEIPFPSGTIFRKKEHTLLTVGSFRFRIKRVLREEYYSLWQQRKAVFEGEEIGEDRKRPVILKLRYQLMSTPPEDEEELNDKEGCIKMGIMSFRNECLALQECQGSGHTPTYITHAELTQSNCDPYPGGYLLVVVMSKVLGEYLRNIMCTSLNDADYDAIRKQMLEIFRYCVHRGFECSVQSEEMWYDREKKHLSITGLQHFSHWRERVIQKQGDLGSAEQEQMDWAESHVDFLMKRQIKSWS